MKAKTNKTSVTIAASTVLLLIGNSLLITPFANATSGDECGEKFTYEKTGDFDDNRVDINFENDDERIDVSAESGYKINKVWLDVDGDGQSGYVQYATGPINNFNPPGDEINKAKVEVEKDCVDSNVCSGGDNSWINDWYKDEHSAFTVTAPTGYIIDQICVKGGQNKKTFTANGSDGCWSVSGIGTQTASAIKVGSGSSCKDISHSSFHRVTSATQTPSPTVSPTTTPTTPTTTVTPTVTTSVTPTVTTTVTPTVTTTVTPTITDTVTPTDTQDVTPTITPTDTPTPTVTTTYTPTPTSSQNNSSNTSNNSNNSNNNASNTSTPNNSVQGANAQAVLGASTMAATGTFINTVMNLMTATGMMVIALSALSYAKEKKA